MKTALVIAATLCFGVSSTFACEFQRSAKAEASDVDTTVVASVAIPQSEPVIAADSADAATPITVVPAK